MQVDKQCRRSPGCEGRRSPYLMERTGTERIMKRMTVFGLATLTAASLLGAESSPSDAITSAAAKLAQQANYSWKTTTAFGNFTGSSEGKSQKDGLVGLTMTFGDNTTEAFLKDGKGAVKADDQDWQSLAELASTAGSEP